MEERRTNERERRKGRREWLLARGKGTIAARGRSALSVQMGCQRVSINSNRGVKSRRGMSIKVKRGEVVSLFVAT